MANGRGLSTAIVTCMIFALTACGNSNGANAGTEDIMVSVTETSGTEENGALVMDGLEEGLIDLGSASLDDSDATMFFYNWYGASAEEGYYFLNANWYLKYYDIATGSSVFLCGKAGCDHTGRDCDAFIGYDMSKALLNHDGYVYGMLWEDDVEAYLWRVSADGSTKDLEYMKLYTAPTDEYGDGAIYDPEMCICDGDLYYYTRNEAKPSLYKVALGGSGNEREAVFSSTGDRADLYRLKQNGDFIFFQSGNFEDDDYVNIDGGIFAYNAKTGEVTLVKKDAISDYCVQDSTLYYNMKGTIYAKSLVDGSEWEVVETGSYIPYIDVAGDVLYTWDDSDRTLSAYDLDGDLIASHCTQDWGVMSFYWGDGRYFLGMGASDDGITNPMEILNLSDFLAGNGEWVKI